MDPSAWPQVPFLAAVGIAAGLWLLARGMGGYRTATRIGDTGTSAIATLAAGEVRVSGIVEPAEVLLVSPLQRRPCVYYRSSIRGDGDLTDATADFIEERAVGFRVRDASGTIRVFPRGARWDAPTRFDDSSGSFGDAPVGLDLRHGSAYAPAEPSRDQAIADLLTVREDGPRGLDPLLVAGGAGLGASQGTRHYREARLEPGDEVTIVGRAMPFSDLDDPAEADIAREADLPADDPEVAANIAEARAAGILLDDPAEAWGNAAIPGFGIDRPTQAPELDPAARRPAVAPAGPGSQAARTFDIATETLVLAAAPDVALLIAHGVPGAAVERSQDRFVVGLLGAILAIASAVVLAGAISGGGTP